MQRSKQQALMFLLGAVLVGGVLGFSAERVMAKGAPRSLAQRTSFYDEFHITPDQRKRLDSIFDETNCKIEGVMKPIRPQLDSLKLHGRNDWLAVMTPEQRNALNAREARWKTRRDSVDKARGADTTQRASERTRRCGGPGTLQSPSGPGGGHGPVGPPGGPFFR